MTRDELIEAVYQGGWEDGYARALADLRSKVLALRTTWPRGSTGGQMSSNLYIAETGTVHVADVLALIDGDTP